MLGMSWPRFIDSLTMRTASGGSPAIWSATAKAWVIRSACGASHWASPMRWASSAFSGEPIATRIASPWPTIRPGLLLRAAARYGIDLRSSFMIGDRWKDVEAARAAGCAAVLSDYGCAVSGPTGGAPDRTVGSLSEGEARMLEQLAIPLGIS